MKRFYKYEFELEERYYTNLSKLCKAEKLNYTNVYHSINRLEKDVWSDGSVRVSVLFFSGLE
jgi:hypothetical protein